MKRCLFDSLCVALGRAWAARCGIGWASNENRACLLGRGGYHEPIDGTWLLDPGKDGAYSSCKRYKRSPTRQKRVASMTLLQGQCGGGSRFPVQWHASDAKGA